MSTRLVPATEHSAAAASGGRLAIAAFTLVAAACAHTPTAGRADPAGRIHGYVEASRVTDFCPDQATRRDDERCIVTRGFDYAKGITVVRTLDPSGRVIRTDYPPGADLSLTPAELPRQNG